MKVSQKHVQIEELTCIMCRFYHVLCAALGTSYVQTLARLTCRFMRELALLAWLALLALRLYGIRAE